MLGKIRKILAFLLLFCFVANMGGSAFASDDLFSGGSGTEDDPYIVASPEDLLHVSSHLSAYFLQVSNISLDGYAVLPIGSARSPFMGNYNGNGFTISGIVINMEDVEYLGLFGYSQGTITGVHINDSQISGYSTNKNIYGATLVAYNAGTVLECSVAATVQMSTKGERLSAYSGGICAISDSKISNCSFSGNVISKVSYIDSEAYSGGICAKGSAEDCRNTGSISSEAAPSSDAYSGGIVAFARGPLSNCYNNGKISATNAKYSYAGGIAGDCYNGTIMSCKNDGEVYAETKYSYAETYSGGICGKNYGAVSFCENAGAIHANSSSSHVRVGGVSGYSYANVEDCKNSGRIFGNSITYDAHTGGIVGTTGNYVRRCINMGTVSADGNGDYSLGSTGGIVGLLQYGTVLQSGNYGVVRGVGLADKLDCFAGGVVGDTSEGTIIDCYNHGSVTLDYQGENVHNAGSCGGIYGESGSTCSYCYNIGDLAITSSLTSIGGIQGLGNRTSADRTEYCYAINAYDDPSALVITAEEAKLQASYEGFDFDNVWAISAEINNGYPYIKTMPTADDARWYMNEGTTIPVTGVWIERTSLSMGVGDSATIHASVLPGNADQRALHWKSSDATVATVTQAGVVTAVSVGDVTITATSVEGDFAADCSVSVFSRSTDEYTFCDLFLEDMEGNSISAIPNGAFCVRAELRREAGSGNATAIFVTYTPEGKMLDIECLPVLDESIGATVTINARINNDAGNVGRIKVMAIPSFTMPQPIATAVEIVKE